MQPQYFNPSAPSGNFIGTNPLNDFTMTPIYMEPAYFNPSLYESFTFSSFPVISVTQTSTLDSSTIYTPPMVTSSTVELGTTSAGGTTYASYQLTAYYTTQLSTSFTHYVPYEQLQAITFSQRFGTELQTVYAYESGVVDTTETNENVFVAYQLDVTPYTILNAATTFAPETSYPTSGPILDFSSLLGSQVLTSSTAGTVAVGSSEFVDMLGSNVYTGLLVTTNSIIDYENEQVSSYYSQSLYYQINIVNLTAALNSVSQANTDDSNGNGTITVTTFSWVWFTTQGGFAGSQFTDFPTYLYSTTVNSYLSSFYGPSYTITSSSVAVTQVQSLITTEQNDLSNSQTFLNNAVTTLQSQVSLAGQIISSLSAAMQAIIANI